MATTTTSMMRIERFLEEHPGSKLTEICSAVCIKQFKVRDAINYLINHKLATVKVIRGIEVYFILKPKEAEEDVRERQ